MATAIRCSSLDSLWACTPSVLASGPSVIRISTANDAALLGNVCHEAAAQWVRDNDYDLTALAEARGLDESHRDDANLLMNYVHRAWDELERFFPKPQVEAAASTKDQPWSVAGHDYYLKGTIDLCSPVDGSRAIFLDWKSGYIDDGYHQQMAGYAFLLWHVMGRPDTISITGVVVFLRHRYYRVLKYDADMLRQWEYDLCHNVLPATDEFRPGKQCRWCDLYASCGARQAVVYGSIDEIMGGASDPDNPTWLDKAREVVGQLTEDNKTSSLVADVFNDLIFRVRLCQQAIDNAKSMMRDAVERVGPVPLSDSTALVLRDQHVEKLDPAKALPVLQAHLSDGQIAQCTRLSLPKLLRTYTDQHARGQKKAMREQFHTKLAEAGAITLEVRRVMEEADLSDIERGEPEQEHAHGERSDEHPEPQ